MKNNKITPNNDIATIWISGVTASGKTTLGERLYEDFKNFGINNAKFLDGENLRNKLNGEYGYSAKERFNAIKQYIKIVENQNKKGNIVIISTVSHKIIMRDFARKKLFNFFEVNLVCSSETCAMRDYKNIYNRINENSDECLPGVTEPFEISDHAELIINTEQNSIEHSSIIILNKALEFLKRNNCILIK